MKDLKKSLVGRGDDWKNSFFFLLLLPSTTAKEEDKAKEGDQH